MENLTSRTGGRAYVLGAGTKGNCTMADPYSYSAQVLHRAERIEAERLAAIHRRELRRARAKRVEPSRTPTAEPSAAARKWRPAPFARGLFA